MLEMETQGGQAGAGMIANTSVPPVEGPYRVGTGLSPR